MSMRHGWLLGVWVLFGAEAARAAEASAPGDLRLPVEPGAWGTRGRLQLRGAFARHDHRARSGGEQRSAQGSAVSHLDGSGAWMAERLPLGIGLGLAVDRFELRSTGATGSSATAVTGLDAGAGLLARLGGPRARVALEGQLGYAFVRAPTLPAPAGSVPGASLPMTSQPPTLQGHGPQAEARVTVALDSRWDLEASARALPLLWGARVQGQEVSLRRYGAGAGARMGLFSGGAVQLSALVGYEADLSQAEGGAHHLRQIQHRVGLGLRAAWPGIAAPSVALAEEPVRPVAPPPAERGRPAVRGVVRAVASDRAAPVPLGEVTVAGPDGRQVTTDAEGRFLLDRLPPGLAELRFSRTGYGEQREVVSLPAQGEVALEIQLRADSAVKTAALMGQVRREDGTPVAAKVRLLELGVTARADEQGRFRFDVPPGRYTIVIDSPGFVSQRKSGPVGAGEQNIFNVELRRGR